MAMPYIYRGFTIAYNDTKSETDAKYYISNPCLRTLFLFYLYSVKVNHKLTIVGTISTDQIQCRH